MYDQQNAVVVQEFTLAHYENALQLLYEKHFNGQCDSMFCIQPGYNSYYKIMFHAMIMCIDV